MSAVSFHLKTTFADVPLSISIPAFSEGVPAKLEFSTIMLSARLMVSVFIVVDVPLIVRFPVIVKSPDTVPPDEERYGCV